MLEYKASLANQGEILNGVIELLRNTSKMIEMFLSPRPIREKDDERLNEVAAINAWFSDWTKGVHSQRIKSADKAKQLMSQQCLEDINSCLLGFCEFCTAVLSGWKHRH